MRTLDLSHTLVSLSCASVLAASASAQWSSTTVSEARTYMAAGAVGQRAVFAGGENLSGASTTIDIYDASTQAWTAAALMTPRSVAAAASIGGRVIVAGGYNAPPAGLDSVEVIDPSTGGVTPAAPLSAPRFGIRSASIGDLVMFAGGYHLAGCSSVIDVYDASAGPPSAPAAWSTMALSEPRVDPAPAVVGGFVLFAGGVCPDFMTGQMNPSAVVDVYDPQTGSWTTHQLSQARGRMGVAVVGSKAIFAGGTMSFGPPFSDVVDIYDSALGHPTDPAAWSTTTLAEPRWDLTGSTAVGDKAIFAGGQSLAGQTDTVDIYDASSDSWSFATLGVPRNPNAVTVGDVALFAGGFVSAPPPVFSDLVEVYDAVIGTSYCGPAVANSTGSPATITALGVSEAIDNDVTLRASGLPNGAFAFFLASTTQDLVANAGGSQGNLCLGGTIGRFTAPGQVMNAEDTGRIQLALDLTAMPQPTGAIPAQAGESWNFQAWYRDANPGATSNLTDAVTVTLR